MTAVVHAAAKSVAEKLPVGESSEASQPRLRSRDTPAAVNLFRCGRQR